MAVLSRSSTNTKIAILNARSVRNKDHLIVQELHDSSVDMAVITETWIKDTYIDNSWFNQSELTQNRPGAKKEEALH